METLLASVSLLYAKYYHDWLYKDKETVSLKAHNNFHVVVGLFITK